MPRPTLGPTRVPLLALLALLATLVLTASGCSGSSTQPQAPRIGGARTYRVVGFKPAGRTPRRTTTVSFTIDQPSGGP